MSRLTSRPSPARPIPPVFPDHSSFTTHAHATPISHQCSYKMQMSHQRYKTNLHTMLTSKFSGIISKSPTDFGRTNIIEMDLPTTGPPVSTKPYTIPLKHKSFVDDEIKLLEDAGCISQLLSDWASPICIIKKKPDPSEPHKPRLHACVLTTEKSTNPWLQHVITVMVK